MKKVLIISLLLVLMLTFSTTLVRAATTEADLQRKALEILSKVKTETDYTATVERVFRQYDFTEEQLLALTGPEGKEGKEGKQGKQGEPGQQGEPGPANVLTIGTVENGEKANATITGTSPSQKLNLTLPKGTDGISITKVEQTQISDEDSGINTIEISLSNGTSSTFEIKNGSKGSTGSNGATFTPNIDDEGNLSWSNDKNLPNPDTKNIKGEKGDTLVEKHYNTTLTENLTTTELEIPASYKVGTNCLQVYFEGDLLEKDIHYEEIGEPNSISNKIKIDWLTNWKEETGEEELIFSFIVQGTEEESV